MPNSSNYEGLGFIIYMLDLFLHIYLVALSWKLLMPFLQAVLSQSIILGLLGFIGCGALCFVGSCLLVYFHVYYQSKMTNGEDEHLVRYGALCCALFFSQITILLLCLNVIGLPLACAMLVGDGMLVLIGLIIERTPCWPPSLFNQINDDILATPIDQMANEDAHIGDIPIQNEFAALQDLKIVIDSRTKG